MLKNMCRTCGRYAVHEKSVRIFDDKNILWSIQLLTGLILENAKSLPDLICMCCQSELREAIRFSDGVIAAQEQLLTALNEDELQGISLEYRETVMELLGNCTPKEINTSNSEAKVDFQAINVCEDEEELILKEVQDDVAEIVIEEHGNQEELIEYEIVIDDNPVKKDTDVRNFDIIENPSDEQFEIANEVYENTATQDHILPEDSRSNEECAVVDNAVSDVNDELAAALNVTKKKCGRKRVKSVIYVCEECGNHISGRMAFKLHCRRHRGDKQFECDNCQDRFCTSSELKSHMRKHTGERPFACQYCERCFADYSTRVKHERTHTNERPYVCQSCGKAFASSYVLKNHMLIHSGERAFCCQLCNKSFRRQTHLNTHYRSSIHKRRLERQKKEMKI